MILKNVELFWARLDPSNPDMGFSGDKPQWNVELRTRSKEKSQEWKKLGLNPKVDDDDDGIFYKVKIMKAAVKKDGSEMLPVPVVGADLMPLEDRTAIGNGSTANVKIRTFEYNFQGKEGVGVRLDAIQIISLVEYEKKSNSYGFEALEDAPSDVSGDEDLY